MAEEVPRRDFLRNTVMVAGGAALGAAGVLGWQGLVSGGQDPPSRPIMQGDRPVTPDALADPGPWTAAWQDRPAVVHKVPVERLEAASAIRGYNVGQYALAHPGDAGSAVMVYDGKCTHLGCTVGWDASLGASRDEPDYDGDGVPDGRILCPCHQAQFDIHDLAANLSGTPAKRPLDVIRVQWGTWDGMTVLLGVERIEQEHVRDADRQGIGAPFRLAG